MTSDRITFSCCFKEGMIISGEKLLTFQLNSQSNTHLPAVLLDLKTIILRLVESDYIQWLSIREDFRFRAIGGSGLLIRRSGV